MQTIKILDEHIANQIAAGEVVERPVSVVKELVENAIDAKAQRITVDIIQGGLELIKVTDNGSGMSSTDAKFAFERHATSKITNEKSLFKIKTLGFRGEALPSISAISKLEIKTKRVSDALGSYIRIEGANKSELEPIGCPVGTQIVVRDLFFNTPARLKYLKTVTTEANHINEYLAKMSMAYPSISFGYNHNHKQIFMTQGNDKLDEVLLNIYGRQTRTYWLPIQAENLDFKIEGFVAKPELSRASRQHISFFVNGRYIRNSKLSEAIIKAYHTLLPINKYPVTCIHIYMDHSLVDVNVHPSKLEVRFSKETELYQLLHDSVQNTLLKSNLVPEISAYNKKNYQSNDSKRSSDLSNKDFQYYDYSQEKSVIDNEISKVLAVHEPIDLVQMNTNSVNPVDQISSSIITTLGTSQEEHLNQQQNQDHIQTNHEHNHLLFNDKQLTCRIIGQIHGTYIVAEDESGMLLIDQHAAHERINYEKAITAIRNQKVKKQDLLVPIQINYTKTEIEIIKENKQVLDQFAVEFNEFGEKTIIIRAYPDWIPLDKVYEFTTYFFDKILSHKDTVNIVEILEDSCIIFACKSAIKGNHRLSFAEMDTLIKNLRNTSSPYTCPHGRPIIVHYSAYELEKLFKRKN